MGSDFRVAQADSPLGQLWRSLADSWLFGWIGHLWFSTLADTAHARAQARQAQEDHAALKASEPYRQVLEAILRDPDFELVEDAPALGQQQLIHAACFDATWIQLRGAALPRARYLRLYCASRFKPFRQAYTFDLAAHEIQRHGLTGAQWHREVPYAFW